MSISTRWWLRHCLQCQARKSSRQTARWPILSLPLPSGPGIAISVDYFAQGIIRGYMMLSVARRCLTPQPLGGASAICAFRLSYWGLGKSCFSRFLLLTRSCITRRGHRGSKFGRGRHRSWDIEGVPPLCHRRGRAQAPGCRCLGRRRRWGRSQ